MRRAAEIIVLFQILLLGAQAQVTVNSATALLIGRNEPGAVQKAASDLASDMGKVFGARIQVVHQLADAKAVTVWIGLRGRLPRGLERPSGWEVLTIRVVRDPCSKCPIHEAIVLTGSDMRGTIYAVYQFSQQFLGVDPLYWWTDHEPARKTQVLVPSELNEVQGPPTFRYRGWFTNDEDLLTGWKPGIADGTGISLKVWDHIFEAILRLKGNMVTPGTFIFPYEPQVVAAGERGLIITQHHVEPLGLNTYRWPSDQPYSFTSHPDLLVGAWRRAVKQYRNSEVVWTVGYRGEHDRPFWDYDKSAPSTDEGRAGVIRAAIENEMGIVRSEDRNAAFAMNAWQESAKFVREGFLRLPAGVTLVWPDNGHGILEDANTIGKGQGEYYHTAMYDGRSNHFTERVPLERIARELGRAARVGATEYLLINTANVRPVVMTTRAVMELAWQANPWTTENSEQSALYLKKWCNEEFGADAPVLQEYYRAYFDAPAKYGEREDDTMGDNFYQTVARLLLLRLISGDEASPVEFTGLPRFASLKEMAGFLAKSCDQADQRWRKARLLAERAKLLIPADRRHFFQAHVLSQVDIQLHSNRMLLRLAQTAEDPHRTDALSKLRAAMKEGEEVQDALQAADYGQWDGFYTSGDWLVNVPLTLTLIKGYQNRLEGQEVPENVLVRAKDDSFAYTMIKAYQGRQRVQF